MSDLKREFTAEEKALIYLCACGLHQTKPDMEQLKDTDWTRFFQLAKEQKLSALCASALEKTEEDSFPAPGILSKFREEYALSIRRTMLFDQEREKLLNYLEESKIWYMPLKGIILKDMYPAYGTRQMADNDILINPEGADKVREWFEGQGYTTASFGREKDDVYKKRPVYNFEIHRRLIDPIDSINRPWYSYYQEVKERLVKDENNRSGYHFTKEDFYVYYLTHACKHYRGSGTGVRLLTDIYIYIKYCPDLDWTYINGELGKLETDTDELVLRNLSMKLLSEAGKYDPGLLTAEEEASLQALLRNGVFGTHDNLVANRIEYFRKHTKENTGNIRLRYFLDRVFINREAGQVYFPRLYRHWWGRILVLFFRAGRGILFRRRKMMNEIRVLMKKDR